MRLIPQKRILILILPAVLMFQSCLATPFVTEEVVNRRLADIPLGETKTAVLEAFGPARFVATIPRGDDLIEILGYEIGNYTYKEMGLIVFRNGRVVAVPRDPYEMLKFMYLLRIIDRAKIWKRDETPAGKNFQRTVPVSPPVE